MKLFEEFKQVENMWDTKYDGGRDEDSKRIFSVNESKSNRGLNEDHSERYRKGSYCATINTDAFEDPSFEDDYLPMNFDIRKGEEVIDTVRGLRNAKARIDDLVKQDQRARMNKWFIGFDDGSTYIKSGATLDTLFDRWKKSNPGKRDDEYYEDPYDWITDNIEDAQLFSSYEEAEDFWYDQEIMYVFADEDRPVSDYIHKVSDMIGESFDEDENPFALEF